MSIITENKKFIFEEQCCTRCGGGGKYSFNLMYGDVCFKCNGKGRTLTKRGQAAQEYYRNLCSVKARDLKVGDVVMVEFMGMSFKSAIEEIKTEPSNHIVQINGITQEPKDYTTFMCKRKEEKYHQGKFADSLVRVYRDDNSERIAQALAYQETLLKTGKEPKRKKKVEVA
jgi:hypothetical protein